MFFIYDKIKLIKRYKSILKGGVKMGDFLFLLGIAATLAAFVVTEYLVNTGYFEPDFYQDEENFENKFGDNLESYITSKIKKMKFFLPVLLLYKYVLKFYKE